MATRTTFAPDTADRILDAADRLIARHGYRKMTIEELARDAGIGKGTVYLSFESKESIALGCIDRMVARLLEVLRVIATGRGTPAERVGTMLVERVLHRFDYARQHSASLDDLLAALRPRLLARRSQYFRSEAEIVARVLAEGRREGSLAVEDPLDAAYAMVLATNALLPYSLSVHELGQRSEIARNAHLIAGLLLRGITVPARDGARARRRSGPRGDDY